MSAYHVEAAIAAVHASSPSLEETDWPKIVGLYDRLMQVAPSPIVALNRAIAIEQRGGPERGLAELHALSIEPKLTAYPFYAAALAEFELRLGNPSAACDHLQLALGLARNPDERRALKDASAASKNKCPGARRSGVRDECADDPHGRHPQLGAKHE